TRSSLVNDICLSWPNSCSYCAITFPCIEQAFCPLASPDGCVLHSSRQFGQVLITKYLIQTMMLLQDWVVHLQSRFNRNGNKLLPSLCHSNFCRAMRRKCVHERRVRSCIVPHDHAGTHAVRKGFCQSGPVGIRSNRSFHNGGLTHVY